MADYRSIITGAIGSVVGKVKEVANKESVRELYEQGANRAKSYGRIAKLTLEINAESENLKRVYAEIGKLYYEQAMEAPEGYFAPLFEQVAATNAAIAAKTAEIDELKAAMAPEDIADVEVEFEEVVEAAEEEACCAEEPCCCDESCSCDEPCTCEENAEEKVEE